MHNSLLAILYLCAGIIIINYHYFYCGAPLHPYMVISRADRGKPCALPGSGEGRTSSSELISAPRRREQLATGAESAIHHGEITALPAGQGSLSQRGDARKEPVSD